MINVGTGNVFLTKSRIEASSTIALAELENSVSLDSRFAKTAPMATKAKKCFLIVLRLWDKSVLACQVQSALTPYIATGFPFFGVTVDM